MRVTGPVNIKLIVFDVDGVLTDGSIIVDDMGRESKRFYVRDGAAIKAVMGLGMKVGVVTGRSSRSVLLRVTELGIEHYLPGVTDKLVGLETVCQRAGVLPEEAAYVGDDLIDIPAMVRCGYPIAVADAAEEAKAAAKYITKACGGRGVAREAIEHVLGLRRIGGMSCWSGMGFKRRGITEEETKSTKKRGILMEQINIFFSSSCSSCLRG